MGWLVLLAAIVVVAGLVMRSADDRPVGTRRTPLLRRKPWPPDDREISEDYAAPPEDDDGGRQVLLGTVGTEIESQLVVSALRSAGILSSLRPPPEKMHIHGVRIFVPERDLTDAREIMASFEA